MNKTLPAILTFLLAGCSQISPDGREQKDRTEFHMSNLNGATRFTDCRELANYQRLIKKEQEEFRKKETVADSVGTVSASSGINENGQTNLQVSGVDESDMVKVSKELIFVQRPLELVVLKRSDKKQIGKIELKDISAEIYINDNKLIVIESTNANRTSVRLFALQGSEVPKISNELSLDGWKQESRIRDNLLIVTSSIIAPDSIDEDGITLYPQAEGSVKTVSVACDQILTPVEDFRGRGFLPTLNLAAIHTISLSSPNLDAHSFAMDRRGATLFVSKDQLLVAGNAFRRSSDEYYSMETQLTQLVINEDGSLSLGAIGFLPGTIKDKLALWGSKPAEPIFIATTESGTGGKTKNSLFAVKSNGQEWSQTSSVREIAPGEDIRAIRYSGNIAYIVTFKKTDPLYLIDISNPSDLKLKGELKVPGFSTQLHPVGEGRLLGIGYDAQDIGDFARIQGVQVSLFDTSNITNPLRLDAKIIGSRGSSSEAQFDHHAVYFGKDAGIVGIPFLEFGTASKKSSSSLSTYSDSGAVFYKIEQGKLEESARKSLKDLLPSACLTSLKQNINSWWQNATASQFDVRRVFDLDGEILMVSHYGIKTLDRNTLSENATIAFENNEDLCTSMLNRSGTSRYGRPATD